MIPENSKAELSNLIPQIALGMLLLLFSISSYAETAFTYQGRLSQSGQPANGIYDMRFNLFDAVTAGSLIGPTVSQTGVKVLDGVFNVMLDFGEAPFGSAPRWLRVEVKETGGGAYVVLFPHQRVGASPFAIETLSVAVGAVDTAALQNNAVTTTKIADGSVEAIDLAPGIYRTKADLYEVVSDVYSLGLFPHVVTAFCNDENDLPITGGCFADRSDGQATWLASSFQYLDWTSSNAASGIKCYSANLHPSNPTDNPLPVHAQMICAVVP